MLWATVPILALHLLCVNLASAGPLLCMLYEWQESRGNAAAGRVGRRLAAASLVALVLGAATGLLLGWLRWGPELQSALSQLSRKVSYGVVEIGFSLALMLAHWLWWRGPQSPARWGRQLVLLLAGTNLLYHFPTLFAILAHLQAAGPSDEAVTASRFRELLMEPQVLAQSVHVAVACFAVAGVWVLWQVDRSGDPEQQAAGRLAAGVALLATIIQLPVGLWLTVAYPPAAVRQMMGQNMAASLAFVASLLGALALMHHLAAATFRADPGNSRRISVYLTVGVVSAMTMVLWLTR